MKWPTSAAKCPFWGDCRTNRARMGNTNVGPNTTIAPITCRNRNSCSIDTLTSITRPRAAARYPSRPILRHVPRAPLDEVDEHVLAEVLGLRVEGAALVQ